MTDKPFWVYVAGKFSAKDRLRAMTERLRGAGYTITSSWVHAPTSADYRMGTDPVLEAREADRDRREVLISDILIVDTLDESVTGGREVEVGLALGKGLTVYVVGPVRNVFHRLADQAFGSWDELVEAFA
jgi:hypothetical protein